MVVRYDPGNNCGGEYPCDMTDDPHGNYVEYQDYAELEDLILDAIVILTGSTCPNANEARILLERNAK